MQSIDELFTDYESILDRRARERADRERAYDLTPRGIEEAQARRDRWAAMAENDDVEEEPEIDEDDEDDDNDPDGDWDEDDYDDMERDDDER